MIAKSNIILDVKPWDDETDMQEMEKLVRTIEADGLLWGACKCPASGPVLFSSRHKKKKKILELNCRFQFGVLKFQNPESKLCFPFAAKLVPVGYGIKKLQICCVVEDDKVNLSRELKIISSITLKIQLNT